MEVSSAVADNVFEDPRLASVYDVLDPDRSDLDHYTCLLALNDGGALVF